MAFGSTYPACPPVFLDAADLRRLWTAPARLFFFTEDIKKEDALRALDGLPAYPLVHRGGKFILTNRP